MTALPILLVASLLAPSFAEILDLNDTSFAECVDQGPGLDVWFVKFYQPWCGYCTTMQPDWEGADTEIRSLSEIDKTASKIHFTQLDCSKSSDTCDRLGIYGFPKLILFSNQTQYDFPRDLDRTKENFVNFAKEGYLQVSPKPIPSGITWMESIRKEVQTVWYNSKFVFFRYPEVASCFVAFGTFVGIATTSLALMLAMTLSNLPKHKRD